MKAARCVLAAIAVTLCTAANTVYADTPAERYRDGQQMIRGGEFAAALEHFEALREEYPWDADYSLGRAQALRLLGHDIAALAELEETTRLAPDYEDAWRLRYSILAQRSHEADHEELLAVRERASEQFPLASWWRKEDDTAQWTILIGAGHDRLSNDLPSWNGQFVEAIYDSVNRHQLGVRLARNERYEQADLSFTLMGRRTWASGWFAGGDLSFADSAEFQPDLGFGLFAGVPFGSGWVGQLGYRRKEYSAETVSSITGTLEKYAGNFRFAYTVASSHLQGASNFQGHTFTTNWYLSDDASIGLTFSTGEEAESLGNGQVLETDVTGLALTGRYQLSERLGLQWWLGTHDQGDFYRRQSLGMAVSIRL